MSFLDQTFLPGERVVRQARFHGLYTVMAWLVFAVFAAAGGVLSRYLGDVHILREGGFDIGRFHVAPYDVPKFAGVALGIFLFLWMMLRKWTTYIVLTDRRLIFKRGIFLINVDKMSLQEVNYCKVNQSLIGSLFDYGSIFIYTFTLDDQNIHLPTIAHPHMFSSEIEELKRRWGFR